MACDQKSLPIAQRDSDSNHCILPSVMALVFALWTVASIFLETFVPFFAAMGAYLYIADFVFIAASAIFMVFSYKNYKFDLRRIRETEEEMASHVKMLQDVHSS